MLPAPVSEKTDSLLALFGLAFVIFGWFALSLTLGSLFHFSLIVTGFVLVALLVALIAWKFLRRASWDKRLVFGVALLYAAWVGYSMEPTLFSGRDQGSIAEAAYRLAANGELAFNLPAAQSFFQIYGAGTALNFPGFAYTKTGALITQFPLGYTAWLASFVSLFGVNGYALANALLLFLFLLLFYGLLRLFSAPFYALFGFALALFSFLPTWFAKMTLTENMSVFLFTLLIFQLVLFLRHGTFLSYAGILLTAGLLCFTRIEGFAFLALTLVLLICQRPTRALFRHSPWKSILIPSVIFLFFLLRDFFLNLPYYTVIGKAFFKLLHSLSVPGTESASWSALSLGAVFFIYGLLVIFCLGLFGLILFVKEKRFLLLLPAFISLPVFFYLFHPSITLDHPWMLRRYLFSLYPTLLFSAIICIAFLFTRQRSFPLANPGGKRRFLVSVIFVGLIILQYPAWSTQIAFAENRSLLKQVAQFSELFSERDLILVDQGATGSGFAMLTGPASFLYHKNTVYFFNPYDVAALDTAPYTHIYLLAPSESQSRYAAVFGEKLVLRQPVVFSLERFEYLPFSTDTPFHLPEKTTTETHNLLFQIY